jgi:hypothetical protein
MHQYNPALLLTSTFAKEKPRLQGKVYALYSDPWFGGKEA